MASPGMKMRLHNLPSLIIASSFLVFYFILSMHARIASDDFYYLWLSNSFGAWGGMKYQYAQWSGRWSAHFIACGLIPLWRNSWFLPAINLLTLAGLSHTLFQIIKYIFRKNILPDKKQKFLLTLTLCCSFFFATYNIGETWFWFIIIITYLWSIISFLLITTNILKASDSHFDYTVLIFASLFIGGASESYALLFMFLLSAFYFVSVRNKIFNKRKIIFCLIIIIGSFLVSVFAPGTEIRHSLLPQTSTAFKLITSIKSFAKYFLQYLPSHFFLLLVFSVPWLIAGFHSNIVLHKKQSKKVLIISTCGGIL